MEATGTSETAKIARITTETFTDYLVGVKTTDFGELRGNIEDFDSQLVMPEEVVRSIAEMYDQRRTGSNIPGPLTSEIRSTSNDNIRNTLGEEFVPEYPKPGEGATLEQARILYWNNSERKIESTGSEYGYGKEIDIGIPFAQARAKDGIPLIAIHTHPIDANLSVPDYKPLIYGIPEHNIRLTNAIMVLCPEFQLLAVASSSTPLFDEIGANNLIADGLQGISETEARLLKEMAGKLRELSTRRGAIEMLYKIKEIIPQENSDLIDAGLKEIGAEEGESEKLLKTMDNVSNSTYDQIARTLNETLISFGRKMGVKLYISRDMKTFNEFSA